MAKERGWWNLETTVELSDVDRDHVAEMIKQGYAGGEIESEIEIELDGDRLEVYEVVQ